MVWGDTAERVAQSVRKGNRVFVSGRVQTRSWETKEGNKRYTTEIVADSLSLLGMRNPSVESAISMDGSSRSAGNDFDQSESSMSSNSSPAEIPAIQYASEIKAEDLPF